MAAYVEMAAASAGGPRENGIIVISMVSPTIYAIDLAEFGPVGLVPIVLQATAGAAVLIYKFSDNPTANLNALAVSGPDRAMARSANDTPWEMLPPKGMRYLLIQTTAGVTLRVHARDYYRPNPLDLLHIYAEGDSNTALDAVSDPFAGRRRWWYQLQQMFAADGCTARFVGNVAQSGSQWVVGSGLAPNPIISATRQNALDALATPRTLNVLLIATSTNDILALGYSLATLQGHMRTWCDNRIAAAKGWLIVPVFIPAMQHANNPVATSYNAWLPDLATPTESNRAIAVVAPRPSVLDDSGPANQDPTTGYYAPNTNTAAADHYNGNGCQVVARAIYNTLRNVTWPTRP